MLSRGKVVSTGDDEVRGRYASSVVVVLGLCGRQVLYHCASFVLFEFRDRVS